MLCGEGVSGWESCEGDEKKDRIDLGMFSQQRISLVMDGKRCLLMLGVGRELDEEERRRGEVEELGSAEGDKTSLARIRHP